MKQQSLFGTRTLAAALAAVLATGLVLAGCANPMQEIEGTVNANSPAIDNPSVTAEAVTGGVKLSWPPIVEAGSYQVWRKGGAVADAIQLGYSSQDGSTGKFVYLDQVSDDNPLTAATEYTYTVIAVATSSTRDNGKWSGSVTTTTIPQRGTKVAKPSAVAFSISDDSVDVTITPGTDGPAPDGYWVELHLKGANGNWNYVSGEAFSGTIGEINLPSSLPDADYAVWAKGWANGSYYEDSDVVKSAPQTYEVLLSGGYPPVYISSAITTNTAGERLGTITGFEAYIDLGSIVFKSGVTYSVERAPVDADGLIGAYATVQLKQWNSTSGNYEDINFANFLPDFLGHPAASPSGYDRSLSAAAGTYQYRIKAVKGDATAYGTDDYDSRVTVNPRQEIRGTIEVTPSSISGADRTYQVKPYITVVGYKNALQTGDKLVVYWISSPSSDGYQTGPWVAAQKLEFTKADLEADTVTGKTLTIPYTAGNYVFAQAYLEYADGTRGDVRIGYNGNFTWSYYGSSSGAFAGGGEYEVYSGSNSVHHYYVRLAYFATSALADNTWADGELTDSAPEKYYTINVTRGQTYCIWANHSYYGDWTKYGTVKVSAQYTDGTLIFQNQTDLWDYPATINADRDGAVVIKVERYDNNESWCNGTYGIAYSATYSRP